MRQCRPIMALRLIVYNLLLLDATMHAHNQPDLGRRATNTASQQALHSEMRAVQMRTGAMRISVDV